MELTLHLSCLLAFLAPVLGDVAERRLRGDFTTLSTWSSWIADLAFWNDNDCWLVESIVEDLWSFLFIFESLIYEQMQTNGKAYRTPFSMGCDDEYRNTVLYAASTIL